MSLCDGVVFALLAMLTWLLIAERPIIAKAADVRKRKRGMQAETKDVKEHIAVKQRARNVKGLGSGGRPVQQVCGPPETTSLGGTMMGLSVALFISIVRRLRTKRSVSITTPNTCCDAPTTPRHKPPGVTEGRRGAVRDVREATVISWRWCVGQWNALSDVSQSCASHRTERTARTSAHTCGMQRMV